MLSLMLSAAALNVSKRYPNRGNDATVLLISSAVPGVGTPSTHESRNEQNGKMPNIQVTHNTDPNNARSEILFNPNNPLQIVAASKKFRNMQTYDFTLATSFSTDGGQRVA